MHPSTPAPTLSFQGLTKRYAKRTVLDRLDLELSGGRVTALLGPNGAGKTTLLKCLLGLVRPTTGGGNRAEPLDQRRRRLHRLGRQRREIHHQQIAVARDR